MSLFIPPSKALDANANPYAGAKWFFYATGTTTPQTVYTTFARNVAHSNPVVADSSGKFPNIFFDPALIYRGILKSGDESVILHDIDPINDEAGSFLQTGSGASRRESEDKLRETVSIKDFGAVCDGVTNDRAAVVLAMAAAGRRALVFPGVTHIATALTITSPISDTSAQIFSNTSAVTISNGRSVRPEWFGAVADNATDCQPAIQRALTAAKDNEVLLSSGIYRTNDKITIKGNLTDGRQKLRGQGSNATYIYCYGAAAGIQGDQGLADYCEASGFTIRNMGTLYTQIGMDIGTVRNSTFIDVIAKDFLQGFSLRKNVDPIGNYYNKLVRCIADCGPIPAGSKGFVLGNQAGGSNREGNANDFIHCRSYGCDIGLDILGIGNTFKGHKIVSCNNGIVLRETSFDNRIEAYIEGVAGQFMGSAEATCVGNYLDLFNDAVIMTRFVDNGWNHITGNTQAGGSGYLSPLRGGDFKVADHISLRATGASIDVFSITLPVETFAGRVTITLAGRTQFTSNDAGVQQYDILRVNSATPTVSAPITNGTNKWTVTPAASGVITFAMSGHPTNQSIYEITVDIQCVGYSVANGGGVKCVYTRLV